MYHTQFSLLINFNNCCWLLDGSSKLMEASIESKRKEEQDLNEQDIVAHRRLRDAIAAAAVECKQHIENSDENLKYLKKQVTSFELICFDKGILYNPSKSFPLYSMPFLHVIALR